MFKRHSKRYYLVEVQMKKGLWVPCGTSSDYPVFFRQKKDALKHWREMKLYYNPSQLRITPYYDDLII